jgi:hypothetical protein
MIPATAIPSPVYLYLGLAIINLAAKPNIKAGGAKIPKNGMLRMAHSKEAFAMGHSAAPTWRWWKERREWRALLKLWLEESMRTGPTSA